jgi:hypothetical protein
VTLYGADRKYTQEVRKVLVAGLASYGQYLSGITYTVVLRPDCFQCPSYTVSTVDLIDCDLLQYNMIWEEFAAAGTLSSGKVQS